MFRRLKPAVHLRTKVIDPPVDMIKTHLNSLLTFFQSSKPLHYLPIDYPGVIPDPHYFVLSQQIPLLTFQS